MYCFLLSFCVIFTWISLHMPIHVSAELSWISRPSNETLGHIASIIRITWHYNCSKRFGVSRISYNEIQMFSRYANEKKYSPMANANAHFSVFGGSNVTVTITDVDKNKNGSYCCEVECASRKERSCTKLVLYALPRITDLTTKLYVEKGYPVTLTCKVSGHPAPRATWIHRDTNTAIANSSVTSFNITGKASEGKYCCQVTNDFGNGTNCTSIDIIALPRINYLTPNLSRNQGDSITLRCNVSGHPAPRVRWIHKDTNRTIANSSVTSFNIKKTSEGKYCCQVSNDYGNDTDCTSLEMTVTADDKESTPPGRSENQLQFTVILVVVCTLIIVIIVLVLAFVFIARRRNQSKRVIIKGTQQEENSRQDQFVDECPYGEPADAIKSQMFTPASNADYATVEETGYKRVTTNYLPKDDASHSKKEGPKAEPVYAKVNKKNKKKDKSDDIPLNPLYAEIPANLNLLTTKHDPKLPKNSNEEEDGVDSGEHSWYPWAF